ncbi:MAG: hypothetical protein ABIP32_11325 [Chthoniobacterales bacterium]
MCPEIILPKEHLKLYGLYMMMIKSGLTRTVLILSLPPARQSDNKNVLTPWLFTDKAAGGVAIIIQPMGDVFKRAANIRRDYSSLQL